MKLSEILDINHPIILAPMFLVSNEQMIKAALDSGITAAIPALNYRTTLALKEVIQNIKSYTSRPFGVNLIVNKSNYNLKKQLEICLDLKVDFIITALGSPKKIIKVCHQKGIKVFCDVLNIEQALKVQNLGADAIIALNNRAGGHLGELPAEEFIPLLKSKISIPIISAGGASTYNQVQGILNLGAAGCSIGSIFIASEESPVHMDYKNAIVEYGEKDIVITKRLSGSPCTVINTPYMQSLGTEQTFLEKLMHRNKRLKKYVRMLIAKKGMKVLEKSASGTNYKKVWCAGVSIQEVDSILPIKEIVKKLTTP